MNKKERRKHNTRRQHRFKQDKKYVDPFISFQAQLIYNIQKISKVDSKIFMKFSFSCYFSITLDLLATLGYESPRILKSNNKLTGAKIRFYACIYIIF